MPLRVGLHPLCALGQKQHHAVDPVDQFEFPGTALQLPGTERGKAGKQENRANRQRQAPQGMFFMSWVDIGIMFWLRWYMTQIEPLSVMTTSTSVKISASIDQPPSAFPFMCRK